MQTSLGNNLTPTRARTRAKIDNVVRSADRFFIMLNNDDRIAEIAQPSQRPEQTRIIALMQTDARFIQNVKNPCQTRANLCRQSDSLRFATGKRAALAIKSEIA